MGGTFQGKAFQNGDWWDFKPRDYSLEWETVQLLGLLTCSVDGTLQLKILGSVSGHSCDYRDSHSLLFLYY